MSSSPLRSFPWWAVFCLILFFFLIHSKLVQATLQTCLERMRLFQTGLDFLGSRGVIWGLRSIGFSDCNGLLVQMRGLFWSYGKAARLFPPPLLNELLKVYIFPNKCAKKYAILWKKPINRSINPPLWILPQNLHLPIVEAVPISVPQESHSPSPSLS